MWSVVSNENYCQIKIPIERSRFALISPESEQKFCPPLENSKNENEEYRIICFVTQNQ